MTEALGSFQQTLALAAEVVELLKAEGLDGVVIGAMALAVHGYARETRDLDLAVSTEPSRLHVLARTLRARGYETEVRDPDGNDPLGGVLDIQGKGSDLVQVVNFSNPPAGGFPRLVADALASAQPLAANHTLRVVDLPHLIAFKLYAGGPKSKLDILELLDRNPGLDRVRLAELCAGYRLDVALAKLLELERDS